MVCHGISRNGRYSDTIIKLLVDQLEMTAPHEKGTYKCKEIVLWIPPQSLQTTNNYHLMRR